MSKTTNILIVGVGGQGVLLASEILSEAAMRSNLDVKKSEVHGMAQRGGVVSSHIRIAEKVHSPLIDHGNADFLMAFETAEGLRALDWLKPDGIVISSLTRLVPPITTTGDFTYPDNPAEMIRGKVKNAKVLDADKIATDLGNPRLVNTILLGVLSISMDIPERIWIETIKRRVPKKFTELNLKAFKAGCEYKFEAIASGE